jgi:hypothetical protein
MNILSLMGICPVHTKINSLPSAMLKRWQQFFMKHSSLIALVFLLTSCYSYKIFPKEYRKFEYRGQKQLAFVINPELKKENRILKQSGIFEFTADTSKANCLKIKLRPLGKTIMCGEPILASALTLGQFPVYFPDKYYYQFQIISQGDTTLKSFELRVSQRYWFWDMFLFGKNFSRKAGKALLANYYSQDVFATNH